MLIRRIYSLVNGLEKKLTDIQKELVKMEEQIITIEKEIEKLQSTEKNIVEWLDWKPNQNIRRRLYEKAGMDTAEYVIKYMNQTRAFNRTLDILPYAISEVTVSEGIYLEFGVFSGKTINKIAETVPKQIIYGFDSFEGLPEKWRTGYEEGTFKVNTLPEVKENVVLVKGWFDKTIPQFLEKHIEPCAFIHIDCDLYSSTKTVFSYLRNRIVKGTVIVFDEYFNYPGWQEGEYRAFQEFVEENNLKYEYLAYVEILEQVAVRII